MKNLYYFLSFLLLFCFGCENGPEDIVYGKDQCAYCKMTISDPKFGAEIVTSKGRVYKFDAIECSIRFLKETPQNKTSVFATAYEKPKKLIEADSLYFVISQQVKSPMGENLAAFSNRLFIDSLLGKSQVVYTWEEVFDKVKVK